MCGQLRMSSSQVGVCPAYWAQVAGGVSVRWAGSLAASAISSVRVFSYCSLDIAGGTTLPVLWSVAVAGAVTEADAGTAGGVVLPASGVPVAAVAGADADDRAT